MNRLFIIAVIAAMSASWGCKKDENKLTTQQTSMVRYLESTHQPRLMSEEAARESLDENPQYYTVYDNETYRYVATMYDAGRNSRTEIEAGDLVAVRFNAYVFNFASLNNVMPYWSNVPEVIEAMEQTGGGLDTAYWSTDPLVLRAGGSDVVKGVGRALIGCREGDEVEVYMTYASAYGSGIVGLVPKESPVAWLLVIEEVNKQ